MNERNKESLENFTTPMPATVIPNYILEDNTLTWQSKGFFAALCMVIGSTYYISFEEMVDQFGLRGIHGMLKELEEKGYVKIDDKGRYYLWN